MFFLDSLKLERSWEFTFLGSLNPQDRHIDYTFMSFSRSLSKTKKWPMKHSSLSFKLHKNERLEKEKGFYTHVYSLQQSIKSSSNLAPISRLCQMGGLSIASESWLFPLSLFSADWLLFQSSMAFGVCFVKSMLLGHIMWCVNKFEDCLPWVY